MIQFYFLSVLLNVAGGFALCEAALPPRPGSFEGVRGFLRGGTARIVLGILTIVTGAFKLLTAIRGDIPVVGDFVPASAGILVGGSLLMEAYRASDPAGPGSPIGRFLVENRTTVGAAGIIAGVVHFLFPTVLFL